MALRPKLGLALGSGSARGWAHVGVLRALAEQGFVPDFVAGCSIGALVGAAFAAGRIDPLEAWVRSLDPRRVFGLLDIGWGGGLIKGERVIDFFREQIVQCGFADLSIQFAAVATDAASGQEVWLREGRVSEAVQASIAVPGLFRPVLREGRYLMDGSLVNPIPVSLCRAMGADIVIAVDLGSDLVGRHNRENHRKQEAQADRRPFISRLLPRHGDELDPPGNSAAPPSLLETVMGAIDIMQVRIARGRLDSEQPDVLLAPRLGHLGLFDYHRADEAIAEGREAVARMLPALRSAWPDQ
ncbi:MAG: patatin-like phospholipase family protein [Burkholderiales bacterium]